MNQALQELMRQGLENACGWTTQAKMMMFGLGAMTGAFIATIVTFLFRSRSDK